MFKLIFLFLALAAIGIFFFHSFLSLRNARRMEMEMMEEADQELIDEALANVDNEE